MKNISNRVRLTGAALAATLVTTLIPAVAAAEPASPQFCESYNGTFDWGIRTSFRKYVVGKVANGEIIYSTGGTTNDPKDAGFAFTFAPGRVTVTDEDTGVIELKGDIKFKGHHGTLESHLHDFRLDIDGTKVKILSNFEANKVKDFAPGSPITRQQVLDGVVGEVTLDKPFSFTSKDAMAFTGTPVVNAVNSLLFNDAYDEGDNLDPVGGAFTCGKFQTPPAPQEPSEPSQPSEPGSTTPAEPGATTPAQPTQSVPTTAPTADPKPSGEVPTTQPKPTDSVPTTAPTADPKPKFPTLRDFLRDFRGNPIGAILGLLSLGGLIAILTGIGGGLLNLFKR